ncbi:GntR family transcriptional regulator [Pseudalkalibacillus decolorationis]|uniref:GntR family transcriptional regulator n=1 Tax=Pseudalkalibacillus decolorationis TaxID=163879 RepID=UPI0021475231|nr:GntR family transcriptional regulator [Pseudalkalibacillus decolorationis]
MDAYNYIKDAIVIGKYEPGMRLTEESLANELQLSRTPIREAIKQLESDGLIVPLKRGVSVRNFTKEDIKQIYDLRTLLEGYSASQAAINRTEEDITEMEAANVSFEKALENYEENDMNSIKEIARVNHQFHDAVVRASRNPHLHFHISKVVVVPLVYRSFYWYNLTQLQRSLEFHRTILTAVRRQDPERARIAMHEHIYQGRDHVMNHLDDIKDNHFLKEDAK